MRQISYSLMDPTGNYTVLVTSEVPPEEQTGAASCIMKKEPLCEQVGFLTSTDECDISLRMAGGEFCGNATMSAAVRFAVNKNYSKRVVRVRVSGAEGVSPVTLEKKENKTYLCSVEMPREIGTDTIRIGAGAYPIVHFPGISHIILNDDMNKPEAEKLAVELCSSIGVDALGLMFYSEDAMKLTPLVYVREIGSLFWENSCASGSAAVGIHEAQKQNKTVSLQLRQPGGVLNVSAAPGDSPVLSGFVRLISESRCEILEK